MHLVIGGAFQGKLDYAAERYSLSGEEICVCTEEEPDWSRRCVAHLERYVLGCVKRSVPCELKLRPDAVVVCDDIFCGVVPVDPTERAWREETGRVLTGLSARAESVERVFCGLGARLK